jgi:DNA-directed RNA polymerase subunit RPC12/RpoP
MVLIKCPECSSDVSDQASSCPRCGHPILSTRTSGRPQTTVKVQAAKSRGVYIILGLFLGCLGVHNFYAEGQVSGFRIDLLELAA